MAAEGLLFTQFYTASPVCSPSRSAESGSAGVCTCSLLTVFWCSASRAAILTGRYQTRSGVYPGVFTPANVGGMLQMMSSPFLLSLFYVSPSLPLFLCCLIPSLSLGLPLEEITIAEVLKPEGYSTAIIGKWHLGVGENNTYLPTNQGFDYYMVRMNYTLLLIQNLLFAFHHVTCP